MTDLPGDDHLGELLADLGANLVLPEIDAHEVVAAVAVSAPARWRLPTTAVAAVIVAIVAATVLAIAPARSAVADWLGIGRTAVEVDEVPPVADPPRLPTTPPDGPAPTPAQVRISLDASLPFTARLPDEELAGQITAWEARTDAGPEMIVVYDRFVVGGRPTDASTPLARKIVPADGVVAEPITPDGLQALWVEGDHVRQIEELAASSRSALLWVDEGVEWRLEGDLELDEALALADSFS